MRTKEKIIDMFIQVTDCNGNEENPCPFFEECDCTEDACMNQWAEWLAGGDE